MTVKLMVLLNRKAGMSNEEFRTRYETVHAPLCRSLSSAMVGYRRNYVLQPLGGGAPPCDVITEVTFADRAAFEQAMAETPERVLASRLIAEDEEHQFDRDSICMFLVDECDTEMAAVPTSDEPA